MRQTHAAGEKLFVDFAGDTVPVFDGLTGEVRAARSSSRSWERRIHLRRKLASARRWPTGSALMWTRSPSWGVPKALVCDNLKAGVTAASRSSRASTDLPGSRRPLRHHHRAGRPRSHATRPRLRRRFYRRAVDFGAAAQPALLLARRVERRDPHPGRRTQRPPDAQARRQPPRVLRHHRSACPDAAAGRALSVRRMASCPRGAGLPCRSRGALLLGAVPHDPPGRRGAGHRGYHRGVPSRHPHRQPRALRREAPPHHDPRAHAERASPIRLLDAGAPVGRRREDRPVHGRAVRGDHAGKTPSRAGLPILSGILRMEKTYGAQRLEAACRRG